MRATIHAVRPNNPVKKMTRTYCGLWVTKGWIPEYATRCHPDNVSDEPTCLSCLKGKEKAGDA